MRVPRTPGRVGGARTKVVAVVAILLLLLAACDGDDASDDVAAGEDAAPTEEPAPEDTATAEPAEEEPAEEEDAAPQDLGSVSLVVPVPTAFYMPPVLADELGLYEECGLDVSIEYVQAGPASGALASGELDFGVFPGPVTHNLALAGADIVTIATFVHTPILSLMAQPEFESVEDLRGEAVAVGVPTALGTIFMRTVLAEAGLQLGADVQERSIASQGDQLSALISGQVSAAMLSLPQNLVAEREGLATLVDLTAEDYEWPFAALATRTSYAEENPEQVECVLAGTRGALERWADEEELAKRIIREQTGTEDEELLEQSFQAVAEAIDPTMRPTESENAAVLEALDASGEADVSGREPSEFYDTTWLDRLDG